MLCMLRLRAGGPVVCTVCGLAANYTSLVRSSWLYIVGIRSLLIHYYTVRTRSTSVLRPCDTNLGRRCSEVVSSVGRRSIAIAVLQVYTTKLYYCLPRAKGARIVPECPTNLRRKKRCYNKIIQRSQAQQQQNTRTIHVRRIRPQIKSGVFSNQEIFYRSFTRGARPPAAKEHSPSCISVR